MNRNNLKSDFLKVALVFLLILGLAASYKQLVGPVTTTDNALIRWDGTGGYKTQNGQTIEEDDGSVTVASNLTVLGDILSSNVYADELLLSNAIVSTNIDFEQTILDPASNTTNYILDFLGPAYVYVTNTNNIYVQYCTNSRGGRSVTMIIGKSTNGRRFQILSSLKQNNLSNYTNLVYANSYQIVNFYAFATNYNTNVLVTFGPTNAWQ